MEKKSSANSVMHSFTDDKSSTSTSGKIIVVVIIVGILGIGSGYFLANYARKTGKALLPLPTNSSSAVKGKTYGSADTSTYKDTAEGNLAEGGVNGEGQYHLVRPGGDSQNVYLTSSSVDLSQFVGKKIKVWGQTQKAQTAGWLMDVGRVQVE